MNEYDNKNGRNVRFSADSDDEKLVARAMKLADGTGVPENAELPDDAPVKVDRTTADRVHDVFGYLKYIRDRGGDPFDYDDAEAVENRYEELREEHEVEDE